MDFLFFNRLLNRRFNNTLDMSDLERDLSRIFWLCIFGGLVGLAIISFYLLNELK